MRSQKKEQMDFVSEASALLKECLSDGKLDAGEILRIGVFVAQKANAVKGLSGQQKKELVVETVKKALKVAVPAAQREQVGYTAALQVLPTVLDIAVAAANGKVALQKVRERVSLSCLLGCFSGMKNGQPAAVELALRTVVEPAVAPEPVAVAPPVAASPEETVKPDTKEESPQKESPKEPTPLASIEESPQEIRPPEDAAKESPSSATPAE